MLSLHTCPLALLGGKDTGGMNVYVRDLARELGRRGFQVDVFTRSHNPCVPRVNRLGRGARVIHITAGPEAPYNKYLLPRYLPQFVEGVKAFALCEGTHYHIIHSHYWLSGLAARELAASWNAPIVHMFHTLGRMKNLVAREPGEMEPELRLEAEKEIMVLADRLVAATPLEKAQMCWLYGADPGKIKVIPPGVDLRLFRPLPKVTAKGFLNVPEEFCLILFVGRIEPVKGIATLFEAIAILKGRKAVCPKKLYVAIIGGDPRETNKEMRRLTEKRRELGIEDVVTFLGARNQDTLPYYYSAADVVVMPSRYESFGLAALEAMACGTPVVASRVGGLAFLVQDGVTGFHFPEGDATALAEKLELLLGDENLREEMGQKALERARQYSWPRIATKIISLYRELSPALRGQEVSCLTVT